MRKGIALTLILVFMFLTLGAALAAAQQRDAYLKQWVGEKVNVQVERGGKSGWLLNVELKEVHPDGIVIIYDGKQQFIGNGRIISVQKTR